MNIENTLAKALGLKIWEYRLMRVMEDLKHAIDRDEVGWGQAEDVSDKENYLQTVDEEGMPSSKSDAYWLAEQKKLLTSWANSLRMNC